MALIKCPECGRENVSDTAKACPGCGYGIKDHFNKIGAEVKKDTKVNKEEVAELQFSTNSKDNNLKESIPKESNYKTVFGVLAAVFLIMIVIISTSENAKKCEFSGCDNQKTEGSKYCYDHTCKESGCTSSKSKNNNYCYAHQKENTCAVKGCNNEKVDGGIYCDEHTCKESGCYSKKGYGSDFCRDHQVDMQKKLGNEFSFSVNSAGGIELNFRAKNNSGKEIKYIRFKVDLYNAVDDKIEDEIKNTSFVDVEITGPILSGKSANYKDIIGYNRNCAKISISEVTLVYSDGTSQTGHYGWYSKK
jgi:hypothetical protein